MSSTTHNNAAAGEQQNRNASDTPPHDHDQTDTVINQTQPQQLRYEPPIMINVQQQLLSGSSSTDGGAGPSNSRGCVNCHCGCHEAVTMEMKKKVVMVDDGGYLDSLPVGFRFVPTDDELLKYYLMRKINNEYLPKSKINEADIYANHPKDIVGNYPQATKDNWYFFTPRSRKYPNGYRPDRQAGSGYWKATGPDKVIKDDNGKNIGGRKSLVYYEGHSPHWTKTKWMMHEYTIKSAARTRSHPNDNRLDDYVLSRIYLNVKNKDEVATDHQQSGVASLASHRVENEQALVHGQPDVGPASSFHGANNVIIQDDPDDPDQYINFANPDLVDNNMPVVDTNRHKNPAMGTPKKRALTISNDQDAKCTSFQVASNLHHVENNLSNPSFSEKGDKKMKRHVAAREPHDDMVPCWERIVRPRVGCHHYQNIKPAYDQMSPYFTSEHSFPTRFNYENSMQHSYIAPTPQQPRNEHAPQGQARPGMYDIGSSSNAPPPDQAAQHCQEGGDDDPINRFIQNIERMYELDGFDHMLDDAFEKLLFDGIEDVDADESKKNT